MITNTHEDTKPQRSLTDTSFHLLGIHHVRSFDCRINLGLKKLEKVYQICISQMDKSLVLQFAFLPRNFCIFHVVVFSLPATDKASKCRHKQTNKNKQQTSKQTNKETNKQPSKQTNKSKKRKTTNDKTSQPTTNKQRNNTQRKKERKKESNNEQKKNKETKKQRNKQTNKETNK